MNMIIKDICWVCGKKKGLTIHHLREFKGSRLKGKSNGEIPLCRSCHDLLEQEKVKMKWALRINKARQDGYNKGFKDGSHSKADTK